MVKKKLKILNVAFGFTLITNTHLILLNLDSCLKPNWNTTRHKQTLHLNKTTRNNDTYTKPVLGYILEWPSKLCFGFVIRTKAV